MNHRFTRIVLLATGLTLSVGVPTPSTAFASPVRVSTSASSVGTQSIDPGADTSAVVALAQHCIDPRHVALVSNALRRGRVITLAEARGWCTDRSPDLTELP